MKTLRNVTGNVRENRTEAIMVAVQAKENYFRVRNQEKEISYSFKVQSSINKLESCRHNACPDPRYKMVISCQPAMWNA